MVLQPRPFTAKQVLSHFQYLKATQFVNRVYTVDTVAKLVRAETLGIDLKGLGLYPEGYKEADVAVNSKDAEFIALQKVKPKAKKKKGN
jgi:hypothetical protein